MSWFTPEFESFFGELKANNNKAWFDANKKRYEAHVKAPFERFVNDLILRFREQHPSCTLTAKDAIFRIYKDVRFAADKTPYKEHASAIVNERGGRKDYVSPGLYIEVGHSHLRLYGGIYQPDNDQLKAIRQEIAYNLEEFAALLGDGSFAQRFGTIRGEQNKRLPAELADVAAAQPLVANKQFYYFEALDPALITSPKLVDALFASYAAAAGMRQFLLRAIS